ncbi:hypothetical protein BSZ39_05795 [Bowdeniella nasicola]|uniref:Rv2175c C-terminal domain-containing protein n=1 Tax=Bowdeniella nasicola TaxID=208480 RepID=A0A1Q5Q2Q7_9ACTO|nr:Rv2175c family DNA-binding protein [Bowdeniella nasicola]OKL54121.1 hypothetical protein BSZ39_05795 [Bowdeniella nasicola]
MTKHDTALTGRLYSRAELAEIMDVPEHRVRNLVRAYDLVEIETDEGKRIPEFALEERGGELQVNPALRGTVLALLDQELTVAEASLWLVSHNDELGQSPLAAMRAGHVHAVRRAIISTAL